AERPRSRGREREYGIERLRSLAEDPFLILLRQTPQRLLRLVQQRSKRTLRRREVRPPRDPVTTEHVDELRKERLGCRVAARRFLHCPRCELHVDVLERLQSEQRRCL